MYNLNRFVYNPGAAGLSDQGLSSQWTLTGLGRLQWVGIDGSPELYSLSMSRNLAGFGSVGGYIMRDGLGPLSSTSFNASYAFPASVNGGKGNLSFGISAGFSQRAINMTILSVDPDPILPGIGEVLNSSTTVANLAAGIFYQGLKDGDHEQFFIGLSGQDLLEPSISDLLVDPGARSNSSVPRSFYLSAGYRFPLGTWTSNSYDYIQPSILARTQGAVIQTDVSLLVKYQVFQAGINYRGVAFAGDNSESIGGILGFDLNEQAMFGYSYDFNLSGLNTNGDASSHELVLIYRFGGGGTEKPNKGNVIKKGKDQTSSLSPLFPSNSRKQQKNVPGK